MAISQDNPVRVFVSYAPQDARLVDHLLKHLGPLCQGGDMVLWSEQQIRPGSPWRAALEGAIQAADVALLLLSPDYLSSPFGIDAVKFALLPRLETEGLIIVPVLLRQCAWDHLPLLSQHQPLPRSRQALDRSRRAARDAAFDEVSREIVRLAKSVASTRHARTPRTSPASAASMAPPAAMEEVLYLTTDLFNRTAPIVTALDRPAGVLLDNIIEQLGLPRRIDQGQPVWLEIDYTLQLGDRSLQRADRLCDAGVKTGSILQLVTSVRLAAQGRVSGEGGGPHKFLEDERHQTERYLDRVRLLLDPAKIRRIFGAD